MSTTAKVIITVQIDAKSNWNDNTTVSQVKKQAIADVKGALIKNINSIGKMKIIGEPKVLITSFEV